MSDEIKFFSFGVSDARAGRKRRPKTQTKEGRLAYNRAYKAKLKAKRLADAPKKAVSKRTCTKCQSPTHATSYWYCYNHMVLSSDKNNDCAA